MILELDDLYKKQFELDKNIQKNHNITYQQTRKKRMLAFLVELGEFSNATRCFKFWSFKNKESYDVILDEYSDGLHFILSIGLDFNFNVNTLFIEEKIEYEDLSILILEVYDSFNNFYKKPNSKKYLDCLKKYFYLGFACDFSFNEIKNGYFKKLSLNYKRQETNY